MIRIRITENNIQKLNIYFNKKFKDFNISTTFQCLQIEDTKKKYEKYSKEKDFVVEYFEAPVKSFPQIINKFSDFLFDIKVYDATYAKITFLNSDEIEMVKAKHKGISYFTFPDITIDNPLFLSIGNYNLVTDGKRFSYRAGFLKNVRKIFNSRSDFSYISNKLLFSHTYSPFTIDASDIDQSLKYYDEIFVKYTQNSGILCKDLYQEIKKYI